MSDNDLIIEQANKITALEANHRLGVALMEKAKAHIAELEVEIERLKALFEEVPCTCDTRSPSYKCPRCTALNP